MTACPSCLGERTLDFRDEDAIFAERFSDAELAEMRRDGLRHPLGTVICTECRGSGTVPQERADEIEAQARTEIRRIIALYDPGA